MLAKGEAPKVEAAAKAGAGCRHSRGETVARQRYKARKGKLQGGQVAVLVIDRNKRALMPCTEKRARLLLERGRADGYGYSMQPKVALNDNGGCESRAA